jgi:hypothetical protein
MKKSHWNLMLGVVLMGSLLVVGSPLMAEGVGNKPGLVSVHLGGSGAEWLPNGNFGRMTLTVSAPGGAVYRQEFAAGTAPTFGLFDKRGQRLPDGAYNWELVAAPILSQQTREEMRAARRTNNEEAIADMQKAGRLPVAPLVQSGSFAIAGGSFVESEGVEPRGAETKKSPAAGLPLKDQVIPDDLIVQGSACVGLDCVNNESFGFDTIRLKENNTRIKFEDTSVGTFSTNDWQLTANDSASGGASKFSIEDITGSKVPFTITAGASTNSIFVDSTGRVGFRTSTPVLDLHVNTSNTPAIRLEQNNSGGFTAQTWDIAGNEANFFVRDVTGGSRLPFRIRPGAPTSSVDISSDGDVGIGTASPTNKLHVISSLGGAAAMRVQNTSATGFSGIEFFDETGTITFFFGVDNAGNSSRFNYVNSQDLRFMANGVERLRFNNNVGGNVITAVSGATLTNGGVWSSVSSREAKNDIVGLSNGDAFKALKGLNPVTFRYKAEPDEQYVGFVAEDVPELVATNDRKHLNSMDVVAVLTKVVQEQQKTIEALAAKVEALEKAKQ